MILLSLIDKILRFFGTSRQQLRWRAHRRRVEAEERRERKTNINKHITYKHKVCETCGQVVDRQARVCPHCEQPVASWGAKFADKLVSRFSLGTGSMTSVLLFTNGAIYLLVSMAIGEFWGMSSYSAIHFGANYGPLMTAGGEWWRLVVANFLHVGGLLHIGFNLLALAMIGPIVEEWYGTPRAVVIYVLTGVISAVASHVWFPLAVSGGASGAVLGLIGAGVVAGHLDGTAAGRAMRNSLLRWFAYVVVFGLLVPHIDNAAHFGGFVAGMILGAGLQRARRESVRRRWFYRGLALGLAALCVVSLTLAFLSGRGEPSAVSDVEYRRAQIECREAVYELPAAEAAELCDRVARYDWYRNSHLSFMTASLYFLAGERQEGERIIDIISATIGTTEHPALME